MPIGTRVTYKGGRRNPLVALAAGEFVAVENDCLQMVSAECIERVEEHFDNAACMADVQMRYVVAFAHVLCKRRERDVQRLYGGQETTHF